LFLYNCPLINIKYKFNITTVSYLSGADINDDYFIQINRGGLTVASDLILELAKLTLSIMNGLTSEKYEENFLRDKSHKLC
jgi:hypothetical protein